MEVDERDESVGRKIRDAELRKIPYMLVVGDREAEADEVAVRGVAGSATRWESGERRALLPIAVFTESYTRAR